MSGVRSGWGFGGLKENKTPSSWPSFVIIVCLNQKHFRKYITGLRSGHFVFQLGKSPLTPIEPAIKFNL